MPPTITSISPRIVARGTTTTLTVTGTGFSAGDTVSVEHVLGVGSGASAGSASVLSSTSIEVDVTTTDEATEGFWDLTVTKDDLSSDTLDGGFTVYEPLWAAPTQPAIVLYYHYNCSGNSPSSNRGFNADILAGGYAQGLAEYQTFKAEAAAYGVTLGLELQNPYGRGAASATLPNGQATTQRLDQYRQCLADGFTTIHDSLLANTIPAETIIYVGSCSLASSANSVAGEGYYQLLNLGYRMVFDALTVHDGDTDLYDEVLALYQAGFDVMTEANGQLPEGSYGLPAMAFSGDGDDPGWATGTRMQPADAPAGSMWWWRTEDNDGTWAVATPTSFIGSGLPLQRRLSVRLDQLIKEERDEVYQLVGSGGGWIEQAVFFGLKNKALLDTDAGGLFESDGEVYLSGGFRLEGESNRYRGYPRIDVQPAYHGRMDASGVDVWDGRWRMRVMAQRDRAYGTGDTPDASGQMSKMVDRVVAVFDGQEIDVPGYSASTLAVRRTFPGPETAEVACRIVEFNIVAHE